MPREIPSGDNSGDIDIGALKTEATGSAMDIPVSVHQG